MFCVCKSSYKEKTLLTEHKIKSHIPVIARICFTCWKCGDITCKGNTDKHDNYCKNKEQEPPTEQEKEYIIQTETHKLLESLIHILKCKDIHDLDYTLKIIPNDQPTWKKSHTPEAPTKYIPSYAQKKNIPIGILEFILYPPTIFKISKRLGIGTLNQLKEDLGNCVHEYHSNKAVDIREIPVNKKDLHLVGNSRALSLKRADADIKTDAISSANLDQIKSQIQKCPRSNSPYFIFLIDPICSITQLVRDKRGKLIVVYKKKKQQKRL